MLNNDELTEKDLKEMFEYLSGRKPKGSHKKMSNKGNGYIPHDGMSFVICPECGGDVFESFPQSISLSSPTWTYEHRCVNCGHMIGITIRRKKNE